MFPEGISQQIDAVVSEGVSHIGFVCSDVSGHFFVQTPQDHPFGVTATWPKVRIGNLESPAAALARCANKQMGIAVVSVYPCAGVWMTQATASTFFAGLTISGEALLSDVSGLWLCYDDVLERLSHSPNPEARRRDIAVLNSARRMCISPSRRILLMVQELHRRGYERLRACTYFHANMNWRCAVVPSHWVYRNHGGLHEEQTTEVESLTGLDFFQYTYSSAQEQRPFGWLDSAFLSPSQLADQYVERNKILAFAGWGKDGEYVRWYDAMLQATRPNGIISSFSEYSGSGSVMFIDHASESTFGMPPPGHNLNPDASWNA